MNIFSRGILKYTLKKMVPHVINAMIGEKGLKREITKTLHQANRRIENIVKAGIASPAVKAVIAERGSIESFSVFNLMGLNYTNADEWAMMKYEYGRAIAFMNNPTSTLSGAKQYINYQAKSLGDIPFDIANRIVDAATSPNITESGNINILNYGSLLEQMRGDVLQAANELDRSSDGYAYKLESMLLQAIQETETYLPSYLDRFYI